MKTQKREQIITLYTQLATVYDINVSQDFRGGKYIDTPGSIKLKFFLEKTKHLNPGTVIKAINIFSNKKKGLPTPIDIFDIISEGFLQTEDNSNFVEDCSRVWVFGASRKLKSKRKRKNP